MAIVFCHKERGISVEEENHLVTVGIVKKSKTILVLLASPITIHEAWDGLKAIAPGGVEGVGVPARNTRPISDSV